MKCTKCGTRLSFDGSCEECWMKNCKARIKYDIKTTNEAIRSIRAIAAGHGGRLNIIRQICEDYLMEN